MSKEKEENAYLKRIELEVELEKERLKKEKALKKAAQAESTKEVMSLVKIGAEVVGQIALDSLLSGRQPKLEKEIIQIKHNDNYGPFGYVGSKIFKAYCWFFGIK